MMYLLRYLSRSPFVLMIMAAVLFFILSGVCNVAFAQGTTITTDEYVPLSNIPGITDSSVVNDPDLTSFWNGIYRLCIGVAVVLAVVQIIRGGLAYMTTDSPVSIGDAKTIIRQSLVGLALVLSPVLVLGIINPDILSLRLISDDLVNNGVDQGGVLIDNPMGPDVTITQEQNSASNDWRGGAGTTEGLDGGGYKSTRVTNGKNEVRFDGEWIKNNERVDAWVKECNDAGGAGKVRSRSSCISFAFGICGVSSPAIAECTPAAAPAGE